MRTGRTSTEPPPTTSGQPSASSDASSMSRASTIMKPSTRSFASAYGPVGDHLVLGRTTLPVGSSGWPGFFR